MRRKAFRLSLAAVMLCTGLLWLTPFAQAQDQASLAATANNAMQRMSTSLSAALSASSETAAKTNVQAAITAGNQAVAALRELEAIATDDFVRSRSKAAGDQTQDAINKAQASLAESGDAFLSRVQAALAEVNEAIAEFAPVLPIVGRPTVAQALPEAGEGDLTATSLAGLGLVGIVLMGAGAFLRRQALRTA